MSVKHVHEVETQPVAGARDATIQVLISSGEGPNFALRRFVIKPGGGMPEHTNAVEHEQYVLKGKARIGIGSELHEVKTGDVIFIPQEVPHFYQNTGEDDFVFLCIIPNKEDRITFLEKPAG
jgi:quercetin dioxygenase-like cupin family protein